jgi:prepilin-type N-terminal cleavage/methylation domain-containing protein
VGKIKQRFILKKKRGFTLVELLVVIAIIAILMMILATCLNRLKHAYRALLGLQVSQTFTLGFVIIGTSHIDYYLSSITLCKLIGTISNLQALLIGMLVMMIVSVVACLTIILLLRKNKLKKFSIYLCPSLYWRLQALNDIKAYHDALSSILKEVAAGNKTLSSKDLYCLGDVVRCLGDLITAISKGSRKKAQKANEELKFMWIYFYHHDE